MHKPIQINNLAYWLPHKVCFEGFNGYILHGNRIAVVGRNGSGKSTLLKILAGIIDPTAGVVGHGNDLRIGYLPQIIYDTSGVSGSEGLMHELTAVLRSDPNFLLLDEPTNHLDEKNKKNVMRMLRNYTGTLILVTHDKELLRMNFDNLWYVDGGVITLFSGNYDDFCRERDVQRQRLEERIARIRQQTKCIHKKLMKEQERSSKRKAYGEKKYESDRLALSGAQSRGQTTSNNKRSQINDEAKVLVEQLNKLQPPEIIIPSFTLSGSYRTHRIIVEVVDGSCGYLEEAPLLSGIFMNVTSQQRCWLQGENRSGKTTLVKALMGSFDVKRDGLWSVIDRDEIGYLDQYYHILDHHKSVLDHIAGELPGKSYQDVRRYLNDFLFRKNEEVNASVALLSGGERVRLCLAKIAVRTPALLLLDEVTNNLDMETRNHVIEVLKNYPGAMLVISHDKDFVEKLGIDVIFNVHHWKHEE